MYNYIFFENEPLPHPSEANENGIVAVGGNLSTKRLLEAYRSGIFPWFNEEPVLWWSPDPRFVIFPGEEKISKSMRQVLKRDVFEIKADTAFKTVIEECAKPRNYTDETWINEDMIDSYCSLFEMGYAHSIEAWQNGELCGGLYGVCVGGVFCGESMFSKKSNASKAAFISLCKILKQYNFDLIDAQVYSDHLSSLGAVEIDRDEFLNILNRSLLKEPPAINFKDVFSDFKTSSIFQ